MKKILVLVLSLFLLFSCGDNKIEEDKKDKIKVVSSIVPFSSVINYIGGDKVEVTTLVPAGVSPHGFDLKVKNMIKIENTDVIFSLGLEHIDGFLDKVTADKNTLHLVDGITLLTLVDDEEEHGKEEHDEEDLHNVDPHVWTSIENIKVIALKIKNELISLDGENKEFFETNYNNFVIELDIIISNFKRDILVGEQQNFIVFHDAYNYLFESLGIDNTKKIVFQNIVGVDPNIGELKMLLYKIVEDNITVLFVEPQFNDSNISSLAEENNMKILILDPLGNDSSADGYFNNLKNNLESLKEIYK